MSEQFLLSLADREKLGMKVRAVWIDWAREQPEPKASWLMPWEELSEPDREVDRRIGEALFRMGRASVIAPAKFKRICADCGQQIGKRHKWHIGADSRIRHRVCADPTSYHEAA